MKRNKRMVVMLRNNAVIYVFKTWKAALQYMVDVHPDWTTTGPVGSANYRIQYFHQEKDTIVLDTSEVYSS